MIVTLLALTAMLGTPPQFGPNLAPLVTALAVQPPAGGTVAAEAATSLTGRSLKLSFAAEGQLALASAPVPVEASTPYLFAVGVRSEVPGAKGFIGVDGTCELRWRNATGKDLAAPRTLHGLGYTTSPWDIRDTLVTAPPDAATVLIVVFAGNQTMAQTKTFVPSIVWLDALQLRRYTPPADPAWLPAGRGAVPGSPAPQTVFSPPVAGWGYTDGPAVKVVDEAGSTHGKVIRSVPEVGGLMAATLLPPAARPGLYRAIVRYKIAEPVDGRRAGTFDVHSHSGVGNRALLGLYPREPGPDGWCEASVDYIHRTAGGSEMRLHAEKGAVLTIDSVRVVPLRIWSDDELLGLYPGVDRTASWCGL